MRTDPTQVAVWTDGVDFVARWGGAEYRARNPFGLDSQLADAGVPAPRDLTLQEAPA